MALYRRHHPADHFTQIPNAWVRDGKTRPSGKAVLLILLSHDPGYRLPLAQVMRETGLGRDGVSAAITHLVDRGYLAEVRQTRATSGRFAENDYELTDCWDAVPDQARHQPSGFDPTVDASTSESADTAYGFTGTVNPDESPAIRRDLTARSDPDESSASRQDQPMRSEPAPAEPAPARTTPAIGRRTQGEQLPLSGEGIGEGEPAPSSRAKPRRRIPEDWQPSERHRARADADFPGWQQREPVEEFRDYWLGAGRPMADWNLTWLNRVRELSRRGPGGYARRPRTEPYRNPPPGSYTTGDGKL